LRTVCHDSTEAQKAYGDAVAAGLRRVLADLRAANTMFDMAAFFDLPQATASEFSMPIGSAHTLVLRCGNRSPPLTSSGEIDWNAVDRLRVLGVTKND